MDTVFSVEVMKLILPYVFGSAIPFLFVYMAVLMFRRIVKL